MLLRKALVEAFHLLPHLAIFREKILQSAFVSSPNRWKYHTLHAGEFTVWTFSSLFCSIGITLSKRVWQTKRQLITIDSVNLVLKLARNAMFSHTRQKCFQLNQLRIYWLKREAPKERFVSLITWLSWSKVSFRKGHFGKIRSKIRLRKPMSILCRERYHMTQC